MDGASKFVRGDAMAGLIITGINIVGGILIGVLQHHVSLATAAGSYTVLTIGEGLVSQVPALIISIAAGFLVSKAGVEGSADKALVSQLAGNPVSLGMVSAAAGVIGIGARHAAGPRSPPSRSAPGRWHWRVARRAPPPTEAEVAAAEAAAAPAEEEPISRTLAIDEVKIELGYGLLPLINDVSGRKLTDQDQGAPPHPGHRVRLRDAPGSASWTTCACPTRDTASWSRRWRPGRARCGSAR